jgi:hypothetical protein
MSHPILPPSDSDGQPSCTSDSSAELPYGMSWGWVNPDDDPLPHEDALWLRWHPGEICAIRVLSPKALTYPGHWFPSSRTYRLCSYPGCQFCPTGSGGTVRKQAGARVHRYVFAVEVYGQPAGTQRLWEFGEHVAHQLQRITGYARQANGTETRQRELLGLSLTLCREGSRANGPVLVASARGIEWPEYLPEPMDAAGLMALSWRRAAIKDGKSQPRLPPGF